MLKFTPQYTVSYKGTFHSAGISFDIDEKDADEMSRHGKVDFEVLPVVTPESVSVTCNEKNAKKGRQKKVSS